MVGIVECIEQVFVKWVYVLKARKPIKDGLELFAECFGGELDFSSVET
jgi:hypothetical protein